MTRIELTAEDMNALCSGATVRYGETELVLKKDVHYASGALLHEFYTKGWDKDYYYESEDALVQIEDEDGTWIADDNRQYKLADLGALVWQGGYDKKGKPGWMTFEDAFLKWKDKQK